MQDDEAGAARDRAIVRVRDGIASAVRDSVAVEEPLEIRVVADDGERVATVTMRTPGDDAELAVGFLRAEGVIDGASDVATVAPSAGRDGVMRVTLVPGRRVAFDALARNFASTASCGVCGRASVDAVLASAALAARTHGGREAGSAPRFRVDAALLRELPARLRAAQPTFQATGGLHAVAAFDRDGRLLALREDIGRHNALDKLVGAALLAGTPDLARCVVLLSGRAGFEMVQKAAVARVPVLAAIGAPSSLAIELADRAGLTLVGFVRESGFNVYTGAERIAGLGTASDAVAATVAEEGARES